MKIQPQISAFSYILRTLITAIPGAGLVGAVIAWVNGLTGIPFLISFGIGAAGGLILGIVAGGLNYKRFVKPIKNISEMAVQIANHDLRIDRTSIKHKGEISVLYDSFFTMAENNKKTIHEIHQLTEELKNKLNVINEASEQVNISSEEIAKSIQEIASGATNQAAETNNSLETTNDLAKKLEAMKSKIEAVAQRSSMLNQKNQAGVESINALSHKFNDNTQATTEVADRVHEILEKSNQISGIIETIQEIAGQTNLLALNAAIEAARAGEQGRGFAVVADEVRKLAEQSSNAAEEIQKIIQEILVVFDQTTETMNHARETEQNAFHYLDLTKNSFEEIKKTADTMVTDIKGLHEDISHIEQLKENVLHAIESISSVAQQAAASTQQVSATTEEQTASLEEIVSTIQEIYDKVNILMESIKVYKVN